jgi:hypothetical protein
MAVCFSNDQTPMAIARLGDSPPHADNATLTTSQVCVPCEVRDVQMECIDSVKQQLLLLLLLLLLSPTRMIPKLKFCSTKQRQHSAITSEVTLTSSMSLSAHSNFTFHYMIIDVPLVPAILT